MANKVQRAQKNAKKEKGQFKKSHIQMEYQRERDIAKKMKHREHQVAMAEE